MKQYRHPKETNAMLFTFGIALIISIIVSTVTLGCGVFLLGIFIFWAWHQLFGGRDLERYEKVSPQNYSDIYQLVHKVQSMWKINKLDIYLNPTREINASASDFGNDFIILNVGLLNAIRDPIQRKFVIGHEIGHIGLGHSWLRILAYQADNVFERSILGIIFNFLLLHYSRMKELSADRIGLLSCNNLDAALKVLAILEFGDKNLSAQLVARKQSFGEDLNDIFSTHPDAYERAKELVKFAKKQNIS